MPSGCWRLKKRADKQQAVLFAVVADAVSLQLTSHLQTVFRRGYRKLGKVKVQVLLALRSLCNPLFCQMALTQADRLNQTVDLKPMLISDHHVQAPYADFIYSDKNLVESACPLYKHTMKRILSHSPASLKTDTLSPSVHPNKSYSMY